MFHLTLFYTRYGGFPLPINLDPEKALALAKALRPICFLNAIIAKMALAGLVTWKPAESANGQGTIAYAIIGGDKATRAIRVFALLSDGARAKGGSFSFYEP